jgi:hypothetical protein
MQFTKWLSEKNGNLPNVEILKVDIANFKDSWEREVSSREQLIRYAARKFPKARFILSDLDEIPSHSQISKFLDSRGNFNFVTPTYFRFANWKVQDEEHSEWRRGIIGDESLSRLRNGGRNSKLPLLLDCEPGLHFSYGVRSKYSVREKLRSFAHQELNFHELVSSSTLAYADLYQIDHLGRFRRKKRGILKVVDSSHLSDLQKCLKESNPEFFSFSRTKKNLLQRLVASMILTEMVTVPAKRKLTFELFIEKSKGTSLSRIMTIAEIATRTFLTLASTKILWISKLIRSNLKL